MEERGYRVSLVMLEFDTVFTAEEVARSLKVSKDRFWDRSSRVRNRQKRQHVLPQMLFCEIVSEFT
jgi:hypothetical protein